MEEIIVRGGNQLNGTVRIEGAKNAVLPILAASLLAEEGITTLDNVPILSESNACFNRCDGTATC